MKNIKTLLMVSIFLLTSTAVSADHTDDHTKGERNGEKHQNAEKSEALTGLDDDTKAEIKALQESMTEEIKALRDGKEDDMTDEEKEALQAEAAEIRAEFNADVIAVLGDNTEAVAAFEARVEKAAEAQAERKAEYEEKKMEREALLSQLDDDTRAALQELIAANKNAIEALKEGKSEDMTDEEKEAMKAEWEALRAANEEKVAALLADYPEVLEAMMAKKDKVNFAKSGRESDLGHEAKSHSGKYSKRDRAEKGERADKADLTDEQKEALIGKKAEAKKTTGKGNRATKKAKYKKVMSEKFAGRLEQISTQNLSKLADRIDVYTERFENNDEITDERRENVLAQLDALTEMIEEIMNGVEV